MGRRLLRVQPQGTGPQAAADTASGPLAGASIGPAPLQAPSGAAMLRAEAQAQAPGPQV